MLIRTNIFQTTFYGGKPYGLLISTLDKYPAMSAFEISASPTIQTGSNNKNNINNNCEFLYSAHIMVCALHTYYPWSLDLFVYVPFHLPYLEHTTLATISAL